MKYKVEMERQGKNTPKIETILETISSSKDQMSSNPESVNRNDRSIDSYLIPKGKTSFLHRLQNSVLKDHYTQK